MSTAEAQNLSSMADDVLRAILARAGFDDQAALKRVCKRFLAVITSRAFREERRASGCLEHTSQRGNANSMVRYNIASDTWDAPEPLPRMGGMYSSGDRYWTNTEPARSIIGSAEGPARSLHVGNCRIPWWTEVSGGSWTTLVAMRTNQYTTPIFAFDGEGAFARKSFAGLPCGGPGGMVWGLATLG